MAVLVTAAVVWARALVRRQLAMSLVRLDLPMDLVAFDLGLVRLDLPMDLVAFDLSDGNREGARQAGEAAAQLRAAHAAQGARRTDLTSLRGGRLRRSSAKGEAQAQLRRWLRSVHHTRGHRV